MESLFTFRSILGITIGLAIMSSIILLVENREQEVAVITKINIKPVCNMCRILVMYALMVLLLQT